MESLEFKVSTLITFKLFLSHTGSIICFNSLSDLFLVFELSSPIGHTTKQIRIIKYLLSIFELVYARIFYHRFITKVYKILQN